MSFLSRLVRGEPLTPDAALVHSSPRAASGHKFDALGSDSIPPEFFGLVAYEQAIARAPRVDRETALQVGAIARCRDLVPGLLGTLPIDLIGPGNAPSVSTLLAQPEVGISRSVTMARTFEDLYFEGRAWWLVTQYGWHNFPVKVKRLDPRTVDVRENGRVYVTRDGHRGQAAEWTPDRDLIRFDSPKPALLSAGARAIRTALLLDAATQRNADGVPPLDYFTPAEGADPADDEDVVAVLDAWALARKARATGFVPAALKHNSSGFSPRDLEMAAARADAVLEIARHGGVDPEDLGVSTTSRTYFNAFDRKQARIVDTLRAFAVAVEERLSMPDVTPLGYRCVTNFTDLLRTDDLTTAQVDETEVRSGVLTRDEVRDRRGLEPLATEAEAEVDPAVTAALDLMRNAPSLAANPGLPALVEGIRAVLNGETTDTTEAPADETESETADA